MKAERPARTLIVESTCTLLFELCTERKVERLGEVDLDRVKSAEGQSTCGASRANQRTPCGGTMQSSLRRRACTWMLEWGEGGLTC